MAIGRFTPKPARQYRVGGSGFTAFVWHNQPIAFARMVEHVSPPPVGAGAVPIQPLDSQHPVEIITPQAVSMGTITLELYELYGQKVWDELMDVINQFDDGDEVQGNANDLVNIFRKVANTRHAIKLIRVVRPPAGTTRNNDPQSERNYGETYHNCVITNVFDGETIEVGTMEVLKRIEVGYTHVDRHRRDFNASRGDGVYEGGGSGFGTGFGL